MINTLRGNYSYSALEFPGIMEPKNLDPVLDWKGSFKHELLNEFSMVPWNVVGNDWIIKFELSKVKLDPIYHVLGGNLTNYLKCFGDWLGFNFFIMNLDSDDYYTEVKIHKVPKVIHGKNGPIVINQYLNKWFVRLNVMDKPLAYKEKQYTEMLEDLIGKMQ